MKFAKKNILWKVDLAVLIVILALSLFVIRYSRPLVISPLDDLVTTNTSVLFSFERGDSILLDDNKDFSSPERIHARDNLVINLEPGVYYWKVEGGLESDTYKLTITSLVDLKIVNSDEGHNVINAGNVPLNVSVYGNSLMTGQVISEPGESVNLSGDEYLGREYG